MGRIVVETTLENMLDPSHTIRCDALVDTGAAYLTLPHAWRERLGPLKELDTVEVETANQSVIQGLICGPVLLRMERFRPVLTEVLFIDMQPEDRHSAPPLPRVGIEGDIAFAEDGEEYTMVGSEVQNHLGE